MTPNNSVPPHVFVGEARLDGNLASGAVVTAHILGHEVAGVLAGADGKFPAMALPYHNQTVIFAINGYPAAQTHPKTEVGGGTKMALTACTGGQPAPEPPLTAPSDSSGC